MLDHDWIAAHIPHRGSMCLLAEVAAWDEMNIECRASSHRSLANPLRAHGRLGAACGIEYAAQAMAVHGALLAEAGKPAPRAGYLVSARAVELYVTRLDDLMADLSIEASCTMRSADNIMYDFNVSAAGQMLLRGRATVVLDVAGLTAGVAR